MVERRFQLVVRSLLLVLLFALQALCHAHAIDHHFDGDTTDCVVCSTGGTLNDAVASEAGQPSGPIPAAYRSRPASPRAPAPAPRLLRSDSEQSRRTEWC
jgi:hypothetical protein